MLKAGTLAASAAIAGLAGLSPALASGPSWDGTWAGLTNRGTPVEITIVDDAAAAYTRGGQPVALKGTYISPNTLIIDTQAEGQVRLSPGKGTAVRYAYRNDASGESASGTLVRQ